MNDFGRAALTAQPKTGRMGNHSAFINRMIPWVRPQSKYFLSPRDSRRINRRCTLKRPYGKGHWIFRVYRTVKGQRLDARDYGYRAWRIWVDDDQ